MTQQFHPTLQTLRRSEFQVALLNSSPVNTKQVKLRLRSCLSESSRPIDPPARSVINIVRPP